MKILIIEDEKELSKSIAHYLSVEGYRCEIAFDYITVSVKQKNLTTTASY